MAFSIHFLDVAGKFPYDDASTEAARGVIVLGDFKEEFLASLYEWTKEDYRQPWKRSIRSLVEGSEKVVLITDNRSPTIASHLTWWVLFRREENILVQNHLLFFDDLDREFNVARAADSIKEYESHSEDGVRVSEWTVSMGELRDFAKQLDEGGVSLTN